MIVKNLEKKEDNTATFQVEADPAEFERAVNQVYLRNKKDIAIPGFRRGKAPRAVVEGMYGPEVFYQDAIDELVQDAYTQGLEEQKLRTVGSPTLSDVEVTDERGVLYTFAVTLYPEVTLGQYKGLEAVKNASVVSDEEVQAEIDAARKRGARMLDVDNRPAKMGDTVNIDFDGYLDGERFDGGKAEGYDLELGSSAFVPGFEEQIVGMEIGQEKDLDITFPENYTEELAGKAVVFKVKLNGISEPELPELDDEFAKDVSEFDTLEEYKASIREKLQKRFDEQAESAFRSELMRKACDNMTVDVPKLMVEEKAEEIIRNYAANFGLRDRNMPLDQLRQIMGLDDEAMTGSVMPSAEFAVKSDMLLDAIAEQEKIEISEEEQQAYYEKLAESFGAPLEEVRKYISQDYAELEQRRDKAADLICSTAVVVDGKES